MSPVTKGRRFGPQTFRQAPWVKLAYEMLADGPRRRSELIEAGIPLVPEEQALATYRRGEEKRRAERAARVNGILPLGGAKPWTRRLAELAATGPTAESRAVAEAARLVPPGRARRIRERRRKQHKDVSATGHLTGRRPITVEEEVLQGQRTIAYQALWELQKTGGIVRYEQDGQKMIRLGTLADPHRLARPPASDEERRQRGAWAIVAHSLVSQVGAGHLRKFERDGEVWMEVAHREG